MQGVPEGRYDFSLHGLRTGGTFDGVLLTIVLWTEETFVSQVEVLFFQCGLAHSEKWTRADKNSELFTEASRSISLEI